MSVYASLTTMAKRGLVHQWQSDLSNRKDARARFANYIDPAEPKHSILMTLICL